MALRAGTAGEPISHNTVRQLLLWYGAGPRLETDAMLLPGEDGLLQFAPLYVES